MLNFHKKATTYTAELLSHITQGLERVSVNWNATGSEAVVIFQSSEGGDPQQYHIQITPMSIIESQQKTTGERGDYSWGPEGPPPGIVNASKLNMKKKSLEIGGETFPDALKFKEETTSPLDVETNVQELYKDAESFVINYIWSGLAAEGIVSPDNANVIQTDVDKVEFNSASSLVNQLMKDGWFAYLELSYNTKLRTDSQLQQQIFNTIQNEITEGVV